MRRMLSLALSFLLPLLALAAPVVRASDTPADVAATPSSAVDPLDRRAWATEVRALRAAERAELATLLRAAREAAPGTHAQAQRAIEDAKRQWRRRVLDAQLVRVRAAGLQTQVRHIESRIAELDAVRDRRTPAAPMQTDGGDQ